MVILSSCSETDTETASTTLFEKVNNNPTNIHFANKATENLYFNFLNYAYIYNGAGVAVGAINNDGLDDLYFSSNQETNRLYVNKGNLEFKDITLSSHTKDDTGWTTGVSMIDINNDGWLDIGSLFMVNQFLFGLAAATNPAMNDDNSHLLTSINTFFGLEY